MNYQRLGELKSMHIHIHLWLIQYGYVGVFLILALEMVGIPFPAETTLTLAGLELSRGVFHAFPLLLSAILGHLVGAGVAYILGRLLGRPALLRYGHVVGLTPKRFHRGEQVLRKYQAPTLIISTFIAGVRVVIPYLAGIERLVIWRYILYTMVGTVLWVTAFILAGRVLESEWIRYHQVLHRGLWPLLAVVVILLVGFAWYRFHRHAKT